jgi:hypothetical protein
MLVVANARLVVTVECDGDQFPSASDAGLLKDAAQVRLHGPARGLGDPLARCLERPVSWVDIAYLLEKSRSVSDQEGVVATSERRQRRHGRRQPHFDE